MNNGMLIALGLGGIAAAVVFAANKKDDSKLSRVPTNAFNPNTIARTSPGQPISFRPAFIAPPGWSSMSQGDRVAFCWNHMGDPAWQGFCENWYAQQAGV